MLRFVRVRLATLAALSLIIPAVAILAEPPAPAVIVQAPAPKQSKYEALSTKTGVFIRRDEFIITAARDQGVDATVVRIEDLGAHQVVFAIKIDLSDHRGAAVISEEEISDLKDSIDYIVLNATKLSESPSQVRLEYRALSGCCIGYSVHRITDEGDELPPTGYIEVPRNPYYPNLGGLERIAPQVLQRIITEAQQTMDNLKGEKK